ncbi:hypothetical protein [Algoriphagus namhaensis]
MPRQNQRIFVPLGRQSFLTDKVSPLRGSEFNFINTPHFVQGDEMCPSFGAWLD